MDIYLDTETTGLGVDAEIIQIGIIDENGKVLIDTLVQCQDEIPISATEIHGIKKEDLVNAPIWPEIHKEVCEILNNADTVNIYNAIFDIGLLKKTSRRYGLTMPEYSWFCVMEAYAILFNNGYWEKLVWACEEFDINISDIKAHTAVGDCELTRRLHNKILKLNNE